MAQQLEPSRPMAQETLVFAPVETSSLRRSIAAAWAPWRRRPLGIFGAIIILLAFLLALTAPLLAPYEPNAFVGGRLDPPNATNLLGTNTLGQDVLSRTIYGAQVSIGVAISSTLLGVGLGTLLGVISAYYGGWLDLVVQRMMEVLASFPGLILVLMIVAALGKPSGAREGNLLVLMWDLRTLSVAIGVGLIFGVMRVVRSAVLKERALPYVEAARTIGAGPTRIMFRHILPNVFPYVIVTFSSLLGFIILLEAGISFLGYGVSIGTASWGGDLSGRNRDYFLTAPWVMLGPGVALTLTVMGANFLGDALRDILDPRLRGSR
ncbi:MAG TPA: ABC transporter permease [Dehalococcoidia bacterium]|nr:ABC transporter permease [Dehalococcoidia bacterium]